MIEIPFLKKLTLPKFSLEIFGRKPTKVAGVDVGSYSTKVVQLRYEKERAILETYGELLNKHYSSQESSGGQGLMRMEDAGLAELLKDILRESNVTTKYAVFSVPATSGFVTEISFPRVPEKEIAQAIPFEARKYVPIPISEVVLDWEILEEDLDFEKTRVLLVAVPRDLIEKLKRVGELTGLTIHAMEIETFSLVRSLVGRDQTPTAIINLGHQSTTLAIVDKGKLRVSHNFTRGSADLTKALERGLEVDEERAEALKKEVGMSEKAEEREMVSVFTPVIGALFAEIERLISIYNRKARRSIQRAILTGGGSNLKGVVDYASTQLGLEVTRGDPFSRVVTPAFMQPILRGIGSDFSVATGLALYDLTSR